jgi:CRISPR-associated endonuclease/helicase Cas3
VVTCTIDTVLALARNNRRGLYSSPAILAGGFVFDELHAYDDTMFAAAVALIRALPGAPFLLMSASLPAGRKAFLRQHIGELAEVPPPVELEVIPRYRLGWDSAMPDGFVEVSAQVRAGARVLWVCNTVARAQAVFDRAVAAELPVVAYHSRFRYLDRVARHRDVVGQFAAPPASGLLAVTAQVAEMSLDLDADLLVTELAPIPALIQRLGRLNRRVTAENPGLSRRALVLEPESEKPYTQDQLEESRVWTNQLIAQGRPLSQRDLADAFGQLAQQSAVYLDLRCECLDSGWCATPCMVREPSYSVTVLLADDAGPCQEDGTEIVRRGLPMPYHNRMERWATVRGALVAPPDAIRYDSQRGAAWAD